MPGPKFGQGPLAHGQISSQGRLGEQKFVEIDFHTVYGLPGLTQARRRLELDEITGVIRLADHFEFAAAPLEIEEAFVTWFSTTVDGAAARVHGEHNTLLLTILEPAGSAFNAELLTEDCRANQREGVLTRLSALLPLGAQHYVMLITPE